MELLLEIVKWIVGAWVVVVLIAVVGTVFILREMFNK